MPSYQVIGVRVINGQLRIGTELMFLNSTEYIGTVVSMQKEKDKPILIANKGDMVGIKISLKENEIKTFRQYFFKGCLFVRAVAESNQDDQDIISISKAHKQWIKVLIAQNCNIPNGEALSELIYTVIEGLISRFLVDGFDETLAINMKNSINQLFNIHQH